MGFQGELKAKSEEKSLLIEAVEPEDLIKYGMIPEFVGRVPVVATLHELDRSALVEILTTPQECAGQTVPAPFRVRKRQAEVRRRGIEGIAEQSIKRNVGARGLRIIMEELMLDVMYTLPGQKSQSELTITKQMVEKKEVQLPYEKAG